MTDNPILVPLTRTDIERPSDRVLRQVMLNRFDSAAREPVTPPAPARKKRARRRTPPRNVITVIEVPVTPPKPPDDPAQQPMRLTWYDLRVHKSIHRCHWCGQWTCATKYQRTTHDCQGDHAA